MADTTGVPRRSMVGPALLALIFLAIIGASVGSILATRDQAGGERPDAGSAPSGSSSSGGTPTAAATPTGGASPGPPCPAVTEAAARAARSPGGLTQLLYIQTAQSEVWICRDRDGRLWYQGHRHDGSPGDDFPATSNTSLFLTSVERTDGGYVATNRQGDDVTRYVVTLRLLVIENPNNREEQPVLRSDRS